METSTCITNALYGALGVMAASQCTMNNFTFGNAAPPVLRDHLRRQRRRRRDRRGGPRGRRLRRHQRRADAHDQLAPHRPRGAGVPLPGAAGQLRDPPGLGRRRPLEGRQRRRAARALPRAHDGQHPVQRPQARPPSAWPAASRARSGINRVVRADGAVEQLDHIGQAEMHAGRRVRDPHARAAAATDRPARRHNRGAWTPVPCWTTTVSWPRTTAGSTAGCTTPASSFRTRSASATAARSSAPSTAR